MAINLNKGPIPSDIRTRGKSNPEFVAAAQALVNGEADYFVCTGAESLSGKERTESARKEANGIAKQVEKLGYTAHTSFSKSAHGVVVTLGEKMAEANDQPEPTPTTSTTSKQKAA
jgi:hypothetical protein